MWIALVVYTIKKKHKIRKIWKYLENGIILMFYLNLKISIDDLFCHMSDNSSKEFI